MCPAGALRIFGRSVWFKRFYNIVIGRRMLKNASMSTAVTADEISSFESYGVNKSKIRVVRNGIAESDFLASDGDQFRLFPHGMRPCQLLFLNLGSVVRLSC